MRDVIEHYEGQTDDEPAAEIKAAFEDRSQTVMVNPNDLFHDVRALLPESPDPAPGIPGGLMRVAALSPVTPQQSESWRPPSVAYPPLSVIPSR